MIPPAFDPLIEFTDPDGERLTVTANRSFGPLSLVLWVESDGKDDLLGVRMTIEEAEKFAERLRAVIDSFKVGGDV